VHSKTTGDKKNHTHVVIIIQTCMKLVPETL